MWSRIFTYEITEAQSGQSIQELLKGHGYSASVIRHLKETKDGIQRNGSWSRVHDILLAGDQVMITLTEEGSSEHIVPSPLPLHIVYEDADLLVINKAAGVPIHPSQGNYDNTLANACAYYFQQKGEPFTYRCINRLDRDTTGLLILARHAYSASLLSGMVAKKEIHREYLALAKGLVPESGVITAPIARKEGSTIEREVNPKTGEFARTHFQRIAFHEEQKLSLVSLVLDTGRTHQIRVHMKHIGHPLPGDFLYHPDFTYIKRQALHSHRLSFVHPITGVKLSFTAPLPEDMQF